MFTPETRKAIGKATLTLAIVMVGLALHQKFVAPHIAPKKAPATAPKA